jgi:anti-anti-sigma factor
MTTSERPTIVRRRDRVAVIDLVGDVNAREEEPLGAAWEEATRDGPEAVILNFDEVGYINSTGIAVIVGLLANARAHRIPLRACGLSEHYREIFEITRLADFLAIEPDEESAVRGAERSST